MEIDFSHCETTQSDGSSRAYAAADISNDSLPWLISFCTVQLMSHIYIYREIPCLFLVTIFSYSFFFFFLNSKISILRIGFGFDTDRPFSDEFSLPNTGKSFFRSTYGRSTLDPGRLRINTLFSLFCFLSVCRVDP